MLWWSGHDRSAVGALSVRLSRLYIQIHHRRREQAISGIIVVSVFRLLLTVQRRFLLDFVSIAFLVWQLGLKYLSLHRKCSTSEHKGNVGT